jgi:hypothetical protein
MRPFEVPVENPHEPQIHIDEPPASRRVDRRRPPVSSVERRALVLALALNLPLGLYGIPYAYAAQTSTSYHIEHVARPVHFIALPLTCVSPEANDKDERIIAEPSRRTATRKVDARWRKWIVSVVRGTRI